MEGDVPLHAVAPLVIGYLYQLVLVEIVVFPFGGGVVLGVHRGVAYLGGIVGVVGFIRLVRGVWVAGVVGLGLLYLGLRVGLLLLACWEQGHASHE